MSGSGDPIDHWNCAAAARLYDAFNLNHDRYRLASEYLVQQTRLRDDVRVLDFGAGTGVTAQAALRMLGPAGQVVCLEPAAAMRAVGVANVDDSRVQWVESLCDAERFACVLCSATIWQIEPFEAAIDQLASRVAAGGTLSFNVPAAYLGQPDEPGEGSDPYLLGLPTLLADPSRRSGAQPMNLPVADEVDVLLAQRFASVSRWSQATRLDHPAFRDWMKLPVINEPFFPGVAIDERVRQIDAAFERCDPGSWRWETWLGWTARLPYS